VSVVPSSSKLVVEQKFWLYKFGYKLVNDVGPVTTLLEPVPELVFDVGATVE